MTYTVPLKDYYFILRHVLSLDATAENVTDTFLETYATEQQQLNMIQAIINDSDLLTAFNALGISETAFQKALDYAKQSDNFNENFYMQRVLTDMRTTLYINRLLLIQTAHYLYKANHECSVSREYASFLTPIITSCLTEQSVMMMYHALQIFGNNTSDTDKKSALNYCTADSLQNYENTAAMHALDLLTHHLCNNELGLFRKICSDISDLAKNCLEHENTDINLIGDYLELAADDLLQSGEWFYQKFGLLGQQTEALAGATPFVKLCAIVISGYYATKAAFTVMNNDIENAQEYIDYCVFFAENHLSTTKSLSLICTRGINGIKAAQWV